MSKDYLFSMIMSVACFIGFFIYFIKEDIINLIVFGFLTLYFLIMAIHEKIDMFHNENDDEDIALLTSALKYSNSTAKLALDLINSYPPSESQEKVVKELEEMICSTNKSLRFYKKN